MTDDTELETRARSGAALTRAEVERLLASSSLADVGSMAEAARKARRGDTVTYGVVLAVERRPADLGEAGEIRIVGQPASAEEALDRVRAVAPAVRGAPLTGFALNDLVGLVGGDHLALAALAHALAGEGLEAVAEAPLDQLGEPDNALEIIRAVLHGGLGVWRASVWHAADMGARLDVIERAALVHRETGALRAFAPLPREDAAAAPSTGFDDVRTVAAARFLAAEIPAIQVDWPLYGPKLAQVAIAYGADDIDGVAAGDPLSLGRRRSPVEDIERQIRATFARPCRRNGRYEPQS